MVKPLLLVLGLGYLGLTLALGANSEAVDEVFKLKAAGVPDETIVAFIRSKGMRTKTPPFELSSDDLIQLRDKGLSPAILNAMLAGTTTPVGANPPTSYPGQKTTSTVQPAIPVAPGAPSAPVVATASPALSGDAAYFAPELGGNGRWILGDEGQWFWQPAVVLASPGWRPYWDAGHWVNSDQGWFWASDYAWGGITFHYGRWHLHPRHGWVWSPDRVWGPAWVVWRSGGDYCGWAPLPSGAVFNLNAGAFFYRGRSVAAGYDFGLDWRHFNFSLVSDLGSRPVLRLRTEVEIQNAIHTTVVLHGYTTVRTGGSVRIVNHGIEAGRVAAARGHPLETVTIHDVRSVEPGRSREHVDTRRHRIEVYRR